MADIDPPMKQEPEEPVEEGWTLGGMQPAKPPEPLPLAVEPQRREPVAPIPSLVQPTPAPAMATRSTWPAPPIVPPPPPPSKADRSWEEPEETMPGWLSWPVDLITVVLLVLLAWWGVSSTYKGYGHSWDEALYLQPGRSAVQWWGKVLTGDGSVLSREGISAHWGETMEDRLHPEIAPVPKMLMGLGDRGFLNPLAALLPGEITMDPLTSTRLPHGLLFALTVGLVYLIGAREGGRLVGLVAACALGLSPRVFGHAHIAASETPLLFMTALLLAVWVLGMRHWRLGLLLAGPVMGLVLATKVTAAILPLPLMLWALIYRRRDFGPAAFSLMFLAPATMLAVWPWFWHDTVPRLAEYAQFYARHQSTALWYMGRPWGYIHGPAAPWHYPFAMLGAGLPEWVSVLVVGGVVRAVWGWRRPQPVLWVLLALSWLVLAASPAAPKYDGDRLFLAVMVPLALLAGHGFGGLMELLFQQRLYQTTMTAWVRGLTGLFLFCLLAGWSLWEVRSWPGAHLNYFNRVVGGAAGAKRLGFETTYWGEAVDERVLSWLTENTRETSGARVQTLALNPLAFENQQEWGTLPADINFQPAGPPPVDWYVIQAREGFHGRIEKAVWASPAAAEFESGGLVRVRIVDGRKFHEEREEGPPALGKTMPPLTVAIPPPPPPPAPLEEVSPVDSGTTAPPAPAAPEVIPGNQP
jgi:hypothetical protein